MKRPTKVVLLDLWKTLVTSHCREPVWNLQRALGHRLFADGEGEKFEPDDDFLRFCLTTPIKDPQLFIDEAARRFGCTATGRALGEFERILKGEAGCVARFEDVNDTLRALRDRGYRLGVVSNLWPFPAERIFDVNGLGEFFPRENRIYSFEVGHRKPEPEIFQAAHRRFGVSPEECLMIGDNLEADVVGAHVIGMKTALIDRTAEFSASDLPEGSNHLHELTDIVSILDKEER